MADPIAAWHADHVNFCTLLDLLDMEVAAFHGGERPDYELMLDVLYYLRHYPDHVHHPREDEAFARIVDRDPSMQLPIARRLQEHRVLALAGEELYRVLNQALDGAIVERSAIEAAAATYLTYYRHHLAAEEREVIPRAAMLLQQGDWAAVAAIEPGARDPLFGDDPEARFRALRARIACGARR